MILTEFDENRIAVINPEKIRKKVENMPKTCLMLFSNSAIQIFLENFEHEAISSVKNATGTFTVYKINIDGRSIAVVHAPVGAPACVANTEELIAIGAKNILAVGCCGCLIDDIEDQAIIIPTAAIRDEGTSYHYAPSYDETIINPKMVKIVEDFMKEKGISYAKGKTWTTDAFYRETLNNFEKRKADGCISVEMECSAVQAMCDFRGLDLYVFFTSGDLLDAPEWDERHAFEGQVEGTQHDAKHFEIALELADFIS